jgi:phytoene synthase
MMGAAEFWQKLATRSQSNLYFALVFLPRAQREAFRNVYRFLRAADDVADSGRPLEEIRRELTAWRRELDDVYAGRARHPIALRLAATVASYQLGRQHFETILDAIEEDVAGGGFATLDELERWCARMSASLGHLCLEILGVRGAHAYAHHLGVALQLANIVRDVDEDAARGRVYLPADVLAAAGATRDDILARRYTPAFARAAAAVTARARALVDEARAGLSADERRHLLVPEIWADVYLALLRELENHRFDVFSGAHRPYLKRRKKLAVACLRWMVNLPDHTPRSLARLFPPAP